RSSKGIHCKCTSKNCTSMPSVAPEKYTIKAGLSPDRMSGFAL
ncbi:6009_t:CDS:1, partial [Entrophospora sp. SA101]